MTRGRGRSRARRPGRRCSLAASPSARPRAHHVGAYVPRDNEVTANFKQIKFSIQAGKFDVALRLFETGAVRAEMRAQARRLPAGLEDATRAALGRATAPRRRAPAHGLLRRARPRPRRSRPIAGSPSRGAGREARVAAGRKFLEAIWRYYNLVDFAVTLCDSKAVVAVRLAFDEAEGYAQRGRPPATGPHPQPGRGARRPRPTPRRCASRSSGSRRPCRR